MKDPVVVGGGSERSADPWLRSVAAADQELLRAWRNAHRGGFFDTAPVTAAGQQRWFQDYLGRPDDLLFLVLEQAVPVGCLGVRAVGEEWDLYNVIRGLRTPTSRGFMARGLGLAVAFARSRRPLPVRAIVRAENPAVEWYRGCGFVIEERRPESVTMRWHEAAREEGHR